MATFISSSCNSIAIWSPSASALDWFPSNQSNFIAIPDISSEFKALFASAEDGTGIAYRILQTVVLAMQSTSSSPSSSSSTTVKTTTQNKGLSKERVAEVGNDAGKEWEYGVGIKNGHDIFMMLCNGVLVTINIEAFTLKLKEKTIELVMRSSFPNQSSLSSATEPTPEAISSPIESSSEPKNVVILSHGFSPLVGPQYRFIQSLKQAIEDTKQWKVIVPDYRPSYEYETTRHGHSERTRMLLEELVCLPHNEVENICLIGHSQGGAVSASICNERVVRSAKIKGLILLGSENPLSYNRDFLRPPIDLIHFIHASGDRVVHPETMVQLAAAWEHVRCNILFSRCPGASLDCFGDDIAHDFLERDMLNDCVQLVLTSMSDCISTSFTEAV